MNTPLAELVRRILTTLQTRPTNRSELRTRPQSRPSRVVTTTRLPSQHPPGSQSERQAHKATPICVRPVEESIVKMRQWRQQGEWFQGAYRTPYGSFCGEIRVPRNGYPEYFILNPPEEVLKGPHAPCFRKRGRKGRFFVHMAETNHNVDAGIIAIERLITHTYQGRAEK